jgi:hypothetical protein
LLIHWPLPLVNGEADIPFDENGFVKLGLLIGIKLY